jgi:hypothetical protein
MTHAQTKVRATVKIDPIDLNRGFGGDSLRYDCRWLADIDTFFARFYSASDSR